MRRLRSGVIGSISAWLPSRRSTAHQRGAVGGDRVRPGAVGQDDGGEGGVAVDRHPRGLLRIAYVRVLAWAAARSRSWLLWRGLDSAPVGRSAAPGTHSDTAGTRGEGADLGEGLAAAGKQEAAAHGPTVAAGQADIAADTGSPRRARAARTGRRARRTPAGRCRRTDSAHVRELAGQEPPLALLGPPPPALLPPGERRARPVSRRAAGRWWSSGVPARSRYSSRSVAVAGRTCTRAAPGRTGAGRATSPRRCTGCPGAPGTGGRPRRAPCPSAMPRDLSAVVVEQSQPQTRPAAAAALEDAEPRGPGRPFSTRATMDWETPQWSASSRCDRSASRRIRRSAPGQLERRHGDSVQRGPLGRGS